MIVRVFRVRLHPGKEDEFERFLMETGIPTVRVQDGCTRVSAGRSRWTEQPEFVVVTHWRSVEALQSFAGADWQQAVIEPEEEHMLAEVFCDHYETLVMDTEIGAVALAARDYVEGWFDGDRARMERALHPELAKRSLEQDASGGERVRTITAGEMIDMTAAGRGREEDVDDRQIDVDVQDVSGGLASATVRCALYVDLLQLLKTRDGWKIVNVAWQDRTPAPRFT